MCPCIHRIVHDAVESLTDCSDSSCSQSADVVNGSLVVVCCVYCVYVLCCTHVYVVGDLAGEEH